MNALTYEEQLEVIRARWFGEWPERDSYHDWAAMSVARSRGARVTVDRTTGEARAADAAAVAIVAQAFEDVAVFLKVHGGRATWIAMTPDERRAFRDRVLPEWQAAHAAFMASRGRQP